MYPGVKTVFDAGAANCGVMRLLEAKGFDVHGIEYSEWVVSNFCGDFVEEPRRIQTGPIHLLAFDPKVYDLVLCTDVLEHIPFRDIENTLSKISMLVKPGGNAFLVIASDPSKHENHPERSAASAELKESGLKIHETVKPRSWWLAQLSKYGLHEDKEAMSAFLNINQKTVHDPRYGYSIVNFKGRGRPKVYEPNKRHVDRIYCLKKT
jgi:SAM-dependent methyltransferase